MIGMSHISHATVCKRTPIHSSLALGKGNAGVALCVTTASSLTHSSAAVPTRQTLDRRRHLERWDRRAARGAISDVVVDDDNGIAKEKEGGEGCGGEAENVSKEEGDDQNTIQALEVPAAEQRLT